MGAEFGKRRLTHAATAPATTLASTPVTLQELREGLPSGADAPRRKGGFLYIGFALLALVLAVALFSSGFNFSAAPVLDKKGAPISLIPRNELPNSKDDLSKTLDLVERYPKDPRAHMFRGLYFLEHKDVADAERELRAALDEPEILKKDLSADIEQVTRMALAILLNAGGRRPEAIAIAQPICGKPLDAPNYFNDSYSRTRNLFNRSGVCGKG